MLADTANTVSIKYTERLADAGIKPSVGRVGSSCDNALTETINGLYKAGLIHRRGLWRSYEAADFATLGWIDWFNNTIERCFNTLKHFQRIATCLDRRAVHFFSFLQRVDAMPCMR